MQTLQGLCETGKDEFKLDPGVCFSVIYTVRWTKNTLFFLQ